MAGIHCSSSLAPRLFPFLGVSGSLTRTDDVVGVIGLGCCSSDPKKVAGGSAEVRVDGSGVVGGTVTVKCPEGAEIDIATVADEAGVAGLVADAEAEVEASVFSVLPGKTSDPLFFLFWSCPTPPIFWRGFANSPTF